MAGAHALEAKPRGGAARADLGRWQLRLRLDVGLGVDRGLAEGLALVVGAEGARDEVADRGAGAEQCVGTVFRRGGRRPDGRAERGRIDGGEHGCGN